jgi:hypothetical protein
VNDLQHGDCQLSDGSVAGDWRLPNVNELASLLDRGQTQPQLPLDWENFFVYGHSAYWTSTTDGRVPTYAWVVDFTTGWIVPNKKTNNYWDKPCAGCSGEFPLNVWPVRNSN